jgi:anaerobic dimethyl sulfoxide reductase subunit C (anchor subunit)
MGADIRITLTAFTVLAPAGALGFLFLAVLIMRERERVEWVERLEHWLVVPLAICMVGLVVSAVHLGTPSNALYVFNGWGRSPLSNEVASAVSFLVVAGVYWLMTFSERLSFVVARLWLGLSCVTALWLVAKISVVYAIPTIPTWDNELVPYGLWAMALTTAPLVTLVTLAAARRMGVRTPPNRGFIRALLGVSAFALVAALVIFSMQNGELPQMRNAFGTAAELVPWYGWAIVGYGIFGTLGLVVIGLPVLRSDSLRVAPALSGAVLVLVGAALIRVAFYSMYMTL